jgi:hypothetical protein
MGCYPIGNELVVEEEVMKEVFNGHLLRRRGDKRSFWCPCELGKEAMKRF